jgi:Flp pilus assembly protein TadD
VGALLNTELKIMATLSFSIAGADFDVSLLPAAARQPGTPAFRAAVDGFLQSEFRDFGGQAVIRVDDRTISVVWNPDAAQADPLGLILGKLQQGRQAECIQLLELLLSYNPDDGKVLYHLGSVLSEAGRSDRAVKHLRRAVSLEPSNTAVQVSLALALSATGQDDEAVQLLTAAVDQAPGDLAAQRALGETLLKQEKPIEALPHLRAATQLGPDDQRAWLGLAEAHRLLDQVAEAEAAYAKAVELNPHNDVAERARRGSNRLAETGFQRVRAAVPRMDAVHYCLDALKHFAKLSPAEQKKLTLEISLLGRNGFEIHNPQSRYRLKSLDGEFSGLALVCWLYVGMQRLAPGADIVFDLSKEYQMAKAILPEGP